ncbi:hypothetical protein HWC53_gp146 [Bacillus phage vB_BmeM-Goe8]|uniref:Uncharacterized protein n=1 Tax=Bacillus phage vB_BmeM-Goe8 TaxID=2593638 RepID=A0A516KMX9_9CAUD|nr:hypothetical protein HWC53_gp146 [Bacillus phage vB_BmeM-Goe8]QDP42943.1 hypothetical protein Goe8_c01700 [Bacillus phage vB_BmeM-Goe8]
MSIQKITEGTIPNESLLSRFVDEVSERYEGTMLTQESIHRITAEINYKIDTAITVGKWVTVFLSPEDRLLSFKQVAVKQSEVHPSDLSVIPVWVYLTQ